MRCFDWLRYLFLVVTLSLGAVWVGSFGHAYAVGDGVTRYVPFVILSNLGFISLIAAGIITRTFYLDVREAYEEGEVLPPTRYEFIFAGAASVLYCFLFGMIVAPFHVYEFGVWLTWWDLLFVAAGVPEALLVWIASRSRPVHEISQA